MKLALYDRHPEMWEDERYVRLKKALEEMGDRFSFYHLRPEKQWEPDTDMVLAVGGDGTFLSAASLVAQRGVPLLGINLGRIGFLSEYNPQEALARLADGQYTLEDRSLLRVDIASATSAPASQGILPASLESPVSALPEWPYALNEAGVLRKGAAMLGLIGDLVLGLDIKQDVSFSVFQQDIHFVQHIKVPSSSVEVFLTKVLLVVDFLAHCVIRFSAKVTFFVRISM